MAREHLRPITISDFSKGVVLGANPPLAYRRTVSEQGQLVLAQGCTVGAKGALVPGWNVDTVDDGGSETIPNNTFGDTNYRPTNGKQLLVDSALWADVLDNATQDPAPQLFRLYSESYDSGGAGLYDYYQHFYHAGNTGNPHTQSTNNNRAEAAMPFLATGGNLSTGRSRTYDTLGGGSWAGTPGGDFVIVNASSIPAVPITIDPTKLFSRVTYPDLEASSTNWDSSVQWTDGGWFGYGACFHQDRYVWGNSGYPLFSQKLGTDPFGQTLAWSQYVQYTDRLHNGYRTGVAPFTDTNYFTFGTGTELITWFCSLNANSLMVMTRSDGAYLIRGSLDEPQVTHLAGVPGCTGPFSHPVAGPGGVFYTTRDGAFMLDETGRVQNLAENLASGVFDPAAILPPLFAAAFDLPQERMSSHLPPYAPHGRCAFRYPYLIAPNGWMYHIEKGSWWQLPAPTGLDTSGPAFSTYNVDGDGKVYALPWYRNDTYFSRYTLFDPSTPLSGDDTVSWQAMTHILPDAMPPHRGEQVREIELVMSGTGQIVVSIANPNGFVQAIYNIEDSDPVRVRQDAALQSAIPAGIGTIPGNQGTYVSIVASGAIGGTSPLPALHELTLFVSSSTSTPGPVAS